PVPTYVESTYRMHISKTSFAATAATVKMEPEDAMGERLPFDREFWPPVAHAHRGRWGPDRLSARSAPSGGRVQAWGPLETGPLRRPSRAAAAGAQPG